MPDPTPEQIAWPLYFKGELRNHLADRFAAEAKRRKLTPAELAANLLETIIEDNLFAAVLDD